MLKIFKFDTVGVLFDIETLERNTNLELPSEYREFLIKYNGGHTPKTTFKSNGVASNIRAFYGLGEADPFYNLKSPYLSNKLEQFIQNFYFPIATDHFGNDIVIGLKDTNVGKIYFYDHEIQTYSLLANRFSDFLKVINSKKFVPRTIEERIEGMKKSGSSVIVNDELIALWKSEIDKYDGKTQETVKISGRY